MVNGMQDQGLSKPLQRWQFTAASPIVLAGALMVSPAMSQQITQKTFFFHEIENREAVMNALGVIGDALGGRIAVLEAVIVDHNGEPAMRSGVDLDLAEIAAFPYQMDKAATLVETISTTTFVFAASPECVLKQNTEGEWVWVPKDRCPP